jgi:hypothetical protein
VNLYGYCTLSMEGTHMATKMFNVETILQETAGSEKFLHLYPVSYVCRSQLSLNDTCHLICTHTSQQSYLSYS